MSDHIDVHGASGKLYRFRLAPNARPASAMSGTFAYVREEGRAKEILFVGETDNLMNGAPARWIEAAGQHQATHLYVRLNISAAVRQEELQDILDANTPVMNG
jgi:hypothetical protein